MTRLALDFSEERIDFALLIEIVTIQYINSTGNIMQSNCLHCGHYNGLIIITYPRRASSRSLPWLTNTKKDHQQLVWASTQELAFHANRRRRRSGIDYYYYCCCYHYYLGFPNFATFSQLNFQKEESIFHFWPPPNQKRSIHLVEVLNFFQTERLSLVKKIYI